MASESLDELGAAPDVISGGGEDFSAFAVLRWPGLVRLAFGLTGVSTPDGPEAITVLPLAYPLGAHNGPTGYAVQVSPATAHLKATRSDGSTQLVTPQVVDGRRYVAFVIGASLRLERLTWLNAAGQVIASTTAMPRFGYTQFQP